MMTDEWGGGDDDATEDPNDGASGAAIAALPDGTPAPPTEVAVVPSTADPAVEDVPDELSLPSLVDIYPEDEGEEANGCEDVVPAKLLPCASLPEVVPDPSEACPATPAADVEAEELRSLLQFA